MLSNLVNYEYLESLIRSEKPSYVDVLANNIGCHAAALRLSMSLLLCYPISIFYSLILCGCPRLVKNFYFIFFGLLICTFNYDIDTIHSLTSIILSYIVLAICGGTQISVIINFSLVFGHLLYGYWITQTDEYVFKWTIPHCVLTLRIIGISFDLYDGKRLNDAKKNDKQIDLKNDDALDCLPNFIDFLSHCYFPSTFLIGPQISHKKFVSYINQKDCHIDNVLLEGLRKLALGLIYMAVFQIFSIYLPTTYLESKEFQQIDCALVKFIWIALSIKGQYSKYICIWLLAEGSLILSGFTWNESKKKFEDYSNVDVILFETTPTFEGIIRSFNKTTNQWSGKYIFRRLKFLNIRLASHLITLGFLALWHGFKSGYYVTFSLEFLIVKMEREVLDLIDILRKRSPRLDSILNTTWVRYTLLVLCRLHVIFFFGYSMVSFTILSHKRWSPVLSQIYYIGHVIYVGWVFVSPLAHMLIKPKKSKAL